MNTFASSAEDNRIGENKAVFVKCKRERHSLRLGSLDCDYEVLRLENIARREHSVAGRDRMATDPKPRTALSRVWADTAGARGVRVDKNFP